MLRPFSVREYSIWTGLQGVTLLLTIPESSSSFRRFDRTLGLILPTPLLILPNRSGPKKSSRRITTVHFCPTIVKVCSMGHDR